MSDFLTAMSALIIIVFGIIVLLTTSVFFGLFSLILGGILLGGVGAGTPPYNDEY